jgi:hypothetical protein
MIGWAVARVGQRRDRSFTAEILLMWSAKRALSRCVAGTVIVADCAARVNPAA